MRDSAAFDRTAWISAALEVLATDGVEGVRVELLARKLQITKGSFYHHFKNRSDLHAAMLEQWRQSAVTSIIQDLEKISDPHERFHQLMRLPAIDSRVNLDMELAVRLWARRDPDVRTVLEEVDEQRISFIAGVVAACGVRAGAARARAILAFAYLRAATALTDEATLDYCERLLITP